MLISQTTLTPLISTFTILLFTALLFFSGYTLQQRTVSSLQSAIRPRLEALKALPQAQPATTTVGVEWGDAGASLRIHADELTHGTEEDQEVLGYVGGGGSDEGGDTESRRRVDEDEDEDGDGSEDGSEDRSEDLQEVESDQHVEERKIVEGEAEQGKSRRRGKLRSLEEWKYSDETEGQKRMRKGFSVLDRYGGTG
ncbi:MAG: hypothetical protein Q9162_006549 [Coniocarpon cinnabarinum]